MPTLTYDQLFQGIKAAFQSVGLASDQAEACARIHADSSRDGINSHGANRVPRFCDFVAKGWVNITAEPVLVTQTGPIEVYDGQLGIGVTNALFANQRAMELARDSGVGIVALRNTTHWMRGGSYGWIAAEQGFASISWTNTESVMPPWGASASRIGNNPLVIAMPREAGPLVLDMAMSQYSYGRLQNACLKGEQMEFPAGFDVDGNLSHDPGAVETSRRIMPMGFWKGSGLAIMLDLLAAVLSQGKPTAEIDKVKRGSGTGSCQIFMLFDLAKLGDSDVADNLADLVAHSINEAPSNSDSLVRYPGESTLKRRLASTSDGINVDDSIWNQITELARTSPISN